jgi:CubicO group peptidase (beta-lactamase class C family)
MTHQVHAPDGEGLFDVSDLRMRIADEMLKRGIPGLAIALVAESNILWVEGFGSTDLAGTDPVTADTLFSIQSAGKTYTATAFLMAASRGLVGLDEPLRSVLPEFRVRSRWGDRELDRITFRHLLSHRSGLGHEAPVGSNYDHRACTFEEHIASIADTWLKFPVGARTSYSNLGMDLVAHALARLTGKSFPDFMRDELFGPLGMTSVTYGPSGVYAKGHRGPWETPNHRVPMLGAGGFLISARDAARFVSFHLAGCRLDGQPLIRADLLREMSTVQWPVDGQIQGFGLGLLIGEDPRIARTTHYHPGGGYGYQTIQVWVPSESLGVVVFVNQAHCNGFHLELSRLALRSLMAKKRDPGWKPSEPTPFGGHAEATVGEETPRRLEGTYRNAENARVVCANGATLSLDGLPLRPMAPTTFVTDGGDRVTFHLDEQGRPIEMQILEAFGCTRLPVDHTPSDSPGPSRPEWRPYLGVYRVVEDGLDFYAAVVVRHGHLHVDGWMGDARLREHEAGLFFTADGDSVEFRPGALTWGGGAVHERADDALREVSELAETGSTGPRVAVGALMRLCDAYRAVGDEDRAHAALELNLRLHPPLPERLLQLAEAYRDKMDDAFAAALCRRALETEPESERARAMLADLAEGTVP